MGKVTSQWVNATAKDGQKFSKLVDVLVDSEGVFSVGMPEELEANYKGVLESPVNTDADKDAYAIVMTGKENHNRSTKSAETWRSRVSTSRWRGKLRVYCKRMDDGIAFLNRCAFDLITGVETTERVICYSVLLNTHFWLDRKAVIRQNGCSSESHGGQWYEFKAKQSRMANDRETVYSVGVGATVYDKITTHRSSGENTERYVVVYNPENNHGKETHPAYRLNRFVHVQTDPDSSYSRFMPYSDEAADFFYNTMMALCKMSLAMDNFLGDNVKLQQAIASKTSNLLGFGGAK